MGNIEKDIHKLTILYFEGKISREDEKYLFDYLRDNDSNQTQFKLWEKEWMQSKQEDVEVASEWKRLQCKIRTQEAITPMLSIGKLAIWRKVAAIAASVLLFILGGYSVWQVKPYLQPKTYFALEAQYGEKSKMVLSDGTVVWLDAGSTLKYSNRFNAVNREVELDGEAYFEVTKQNGATFIVKTRSYDIRVKGTKFNVTAYSDDSFITTALLEGAVDLLYKGQEIKLSPGESIRLDLDSDTFTRNRANVAQAKAWSENRIEYDGITLKELVKRLSRQYNVKIFLESNKNESKEFRVSIRNGETIGEVLNAISKIIPLKIERKENDIYIKEKE